MVRAPLLKKDTSGKGVRSSHVLHGSFSFLEAVFARIEAKREDSGFCLKYSQQNPVGRRVSSGEPMHNKRWQT